MQLPAPGPSNFSLAVTHAGVESGFVSERPIQDPAREADLGASPERPPRKHIKVRAWHILLLAAAVVTCLLLARWQWHRYQSGSGTFQNLGYAMQWPFFAAFFVYAYRMGIKMENEKIDAENAGSTMEDLYEADLRRYGGVATARGEAATTEIDESFLPERPRLDVEEYNKMLTPRRRQPREHHNDLSQENQ